MKKKVKQPAVKVAKQNAVDSAAAVSKERDSQTYHGHTLEVKVLNNGFEYQGKVYKSISRVAMDIVKRPISGYVFFGLTK